MEELRKKLNNLIDMEGVSSKEVIKASTDLDKLIVKYYQEIIIIRYSSQLLHK